MVLVVVVVPVVPVVHRMEEMEYSQTSQGHLPSMEVVVPQETLVLLEEKVAAVLEEMDSLELDKTELMVLAAVAAAAVAMLT